MEDKAYNIAEKIANIAKSFELEESNFKANENKIFDLAKNKNIDTTGMTVAEAGQALLSRNDLTEEERKSVYNAITGMMGSVDAMYEANATAAEETF